VNPKRWLAIFILAGASAWMAQAQFGGLINKAKAKIDQAKDKSKPVTDRAERAVDAFTPWSLQEEEDLGTASAAKMIAMFGLYEEPRLVKYVNLTGSTVARYAARQVPYRFAILDTDIVGAFALPGGFIFITKAAVEGMNNEAELAGALGHEIIHVSERHLESEIRSKKTSAWAVQEGKSASSGTVADVLRGKADALLSDLFNTRLSRDKEDGADARGAQLAAQAGYAPDGLLNFLRTLATVHALPGTERTFGQLLSTHPSFEDRIASLERSSQTGSGKTLETRFHNALQ